MKPTKKSRTQSGASKSRSAKRKPATIANGNGSPVRVIKAQRAAPVAKKPVVPLNRAAQALVRLNISTDALATAPDITSMLIEVKGDMKKLLTAMRLSQDEVLVAFLKKYDAIPAADREALSIEAIALAAGVNLVYLLGSIQMAMQAYSAGRVKTIVWAGHPLLAKARIKYGQLPGGVKDRDAIDTALGFLPSPKGPTFIGKAIFGSGKQVMDEQNAGKGNDEDDDGVGMDPSEIDIDKLFPPANRMQDILTPIRQRLLPPVESANKWNPDHLDDDDPHRYDAIKKACDGHKR
jgi:hypothetical protein